MPDAADDRPAPRPTLAVGVVAAGMVLFALAAHRSGFWFGAGVATLLVVTATIGTTLRMEADPAVVLGLTPLSARAKLLAALSLALGLAAGVSHRRELGLTAWPTGGIELFAAVACLIGITEELLYRGWLQGTARRYGWLVAVLIAAAAHAAYKTAIFAWTPDSASLDLASMARWTFAGGAALGLLREFSKSVVPPALAHAAFDFIVYAAVARAPWWVWT